MLAVKLVTLLLLALAVVGLRLESTHQKQPKSVTFKLTEKYSLPYAP